ncbi:MBL fold metallo-hydrolase [Methanopyrus sp.]
MELEIWSPVRLFGATPGAVVGISRTDTEVLFDPGGWRPGYDKRVPPWAELPEDLKSAPGLFSLFGEPDPDYTLITHHHTDHAKHGGEYGESFAHPDAAEKIERRFGYRPEDPSRCEVVVETVETGHCPGAVAYLVELDGIRVFFTGDVNTETFLDAHLPRADVLISECSGVPGHLDRTGLELLCRKVKPRIVVPVHLIAYDPWFIRELDVDAAVIEPHLGLSVDLEPALNAEVPCAREYHMCTRCERGRGCPVFRFVRHLRCPECGNPPTLDGEDSESVRLVCPRCCARSSTVDYAEIIKAVAEYAVERSDVEDWKPAEARPGEYSSSECRLKEFSPRPESGEDRNV